MFNYLLHMINWLRFMSILDIYLRILNVNFLYTFSLFNHSELSGAIVDKNFVRL